MTIPNSLRALRAHSAWALAVSAAMLATHAVAADEAAQLALGRKLFSSAVPACALCHSLKHAGATGSIGPDLDDLKPDAARVAAALRSGVGSMPSFKDSLSEEQITAVARYVANASAAK